MRNHFQAIKLNIYKSSSKICAIKVKHNMRKQKSWGL